MKGLPPVLVAAAFLVAAAGTSSAAEPTRESFTAAVEPICQANTQVNQKILKGVKSKVQSGKLDVAAKQFEGAAKALKRTFGELKAVPQPPADQAKLSKWLGYVKAEADLFQQASDKLAAGDRGAAQATVVRLTHNANLANNQVLAFEFTYCRFDPSKFT